ncbi:MAG TPA: hypothetical protein VIM84_14545, partial [Gemmatimonadales bacterium]
MDKEDDAQDGQSGSKSKEEVVAASQRPLDQPFSEGWCHRPTVEVEPVALGPGGTGAAAPGA